MTEFLPTIGTVVAGPIIAAIVAILIKLGVLKSPTAQIWGTILLGAIWAILVMASQAFPGTAIYIIAVVEFLAALLGAAGGMAFMAFGAHALAVE